VRQQAFHFTAQSLIAVTGVLEKVCPVLFFQLQPSEKVLRLAASVQAS